MKAPPYIVDNEKYHGEVELVRKAAARGFTSYIPPYDGLEKRAAKHYATYKRLLAVRCRPPAFPRIVTDASLAAWFAKMKRMARKAKGSREIATRLALNGASRTTT